MKSLIDLETGYSQQPKPPKRPPLDTVFDVVMANYGWKPRKGTAKRR